MPSHEIAAIFESLPGRFQKGAVAKPRTFYFSLDDDEKWTVRLTKDKCEVTPGKPATEADCFFKSSRQMFLEVWSGKYVPSIKDFMMGTIKSNNPLLLKDFVAAFKKA
jgi:putative sterol carrier protein